MDDSGFAEFLHTRYGIVDLEVVGKGGMGVVYRARDTKLQRQVAVKRLIPQVAGGHTDHDRFGDEMVTLGKISHSAVVNIFTGGVTDAGEAFFIMEYVPGQNLAQLINGRRDWNSRFSVSEAVELLRPIAGALDYIHLKMDPPIVHRDIKPANILIPAEGSRDVRSMLTDFGVSLSPDDTRVTELSVLVGTEKYFAPELYPGREHGATDTMHNRPSAASDNYALALVAFEMITLFPLRETMTTSDWEADRPFPDLFELGVADRDLGDLDAISAVLAKALAPAPAYRYPTAVAFIEALSWTGDRGSTLTPEQVRRPNPGRSAAASAPTNNGGMSPPQTTPQTAPRNVPQTPTDTGFPAAPAQASAPPRRRGLITGVVATAVAVMALAGTTAWLTLGGEQWEPEQEPTLAAFPGILAEHQGTANWAEVSCAVAEPEPDQESKILCTGEGIGLTLADYGDRAVRDGYLPVGDTVLIGNDTCRINQTEVPNDAETAFVLAPEEERSQFLVLVWGPEAEEKKMGIPLC